MIILSLGNFVKRYYMFNCKICQCKFEAHSSEVDIFMVREYVSSVSCRCPECKNKVYSENLDGYIKEDHE